MLSPPNPTETVQGIKRMTSQEMPPSPVLHGLKYGCKRKGSTMTPQSGPGKMHRRSSEEAVEANLLRKKATLVLDDGTRRGPLVRRGGVGLGRGRLQHGDGRLPGGAHRPVVPRPDPHVHLPAHRQLRCAPRRYRRLGPSVFFESESIHITALLVSEYSSDSVHWNQEQSLGSWLKQHNVPGLSGIDTRALTKRIRERGAMLGKIVFEGTAEEAVPLVDPNLKNLVAEVSIAAPTLYTSQKEEVRLNKAGKRMRILAIDCGMKANIIRYFMTRGVELLVVPWDHDVSKEQ